MKNRIRIAFALVVLVAVVSFNVAPALAAVASELPCYDMWQRCLDRGGSAEYCEGVWCGCMEATYGYICPVQAN